ncbi:MAG: hypothetical protein HC824_13230 [Synechococcales cyanobacterium RM1_1_8]|nr:hypothetical protein [Synechococcales cyanobacterium RM1_1_8]
MNRCWSILSLLAVTSRAALALGLGLTSQPPAAGAEQPKLAQTRPSAACLSEQYGYSFSQWQRWQSFTTAPSPADLLQLRAMLQIAGGTPQMTQLAIDRLTDPYNLTRNPSLLRWIEQTPASQRSQWIPLVDRLVVLAQELPPGYNYAQSRALVTAAQAYNQLGQQPRSAPLLQQASKTLAGITLPVLQAEVQWRLAGAWFSLGQTAEGNRRLAAIAPCSKQPQNPAANPASPSTAIPAKSGCNSLTMLCNASSSTSPPPWFAMLCPFPCAANSSFGLQRPICGANKCNRRSRCLTKP